MMIKEVVCRIVSLILHVFMVNINCWDSHCFRISSFVFVGCISFECMYIDRTGVI